MKHLLKLIVLFSMLVCHLASAEVTFVHADILGSPVAETNASGQLVMLSHYRALGDEIEQKRDDAGYTGHKYDVDLALSYMQQRYYDPLIGRFYSNDPVDLLGHMRRGNPTMGFNRYAYANNNPYKYRDPDGRAAVLSTLTKFVRFSPDLIVRFSPS